MIGGSKGVKVHMDKLADLHWNDEECRHALCVKLKSVAGRTRRRSARWCEGSGVDLAPVDEGSIEYASLVCSHTNCGLRSIASGCDSENEKLGDGSKYDLEILRKRDKLFAKAVEEGVWWLVVEAVVLERIQSWSSSGASRGIRPATCSSR